MHPNFFHLIRLTLLVGAAVLAVQSHAQIQAFQPQTTVGSGVFGAVPSSLSLGGTVPLGAPLGGAAPPPVMVQRPDASVVDAPRTLSVKPPKPQVPSQFQRFVQEGTGRLLPNYGSELFENPQAYTADVAVPAPSDYILSAGDEVRVQIWGSVDYAGTHTLDRSGQINLPKVGTIALAGTQVKDLEAVLRKHVGTVFNNISLNANLGRLRGITVYVVGQAQQPGTYNLSSLSTLVNALFASGGPTANGSMRNIQIKRAGKTVTTFDLYDFISKGDKTKDVSLQSGDVITIPPAGHRVAVTGAWDYAAIYELTAQTRLQDILALGGGLPSLVSTQRAVIERISPQSAQPRFVQDLVLNAQGLDQALKDGDVVTLLPISPAIANAVTLQGNVAQPLRHAWREGMRVQDLVPDRDALITPDYYKRINKLVQILENDKPKDTKEAGSKLNERLRFLVDQVNWDYAVIERMDKHLLRQELLPFNLGKAVFNQDPAHNLLLQPGDVITIMGKNDMRLPVERQTQLVRIEGEVAVPGLYPILPGETLPLLLKRVGGLTPQAYLFGAEFSRESVRRQQQDNLDSIIYRLESQMASAGAFIAANQSGDRVSQGATLQQQQQAQMQLQINRLKTLKSKGRVSLELDPLFTNAASLPNLPLEDGDTFMVPSLPAFLTAVGSVNNENALIYRPGKTVGDVILSAGLTEDAEVRESFVLRADGSILSRRGGGLFSNFDSLKLMPGDTLVVPPKADRETSYNFVTRALRDWTQIFSNLGLGAVAIKTLRN
jgi:protein involved in polysaccharide export with SLBB domain